MYDRFKEIFYLTIFFTVMAFLMDIHGTNKLAYFIINHVISILLAIIISWFIYHAIKLK